MKRINQIEPWYDEQEKKALAAYLDSGAWLTEFKQTREFERMLAEYVGTGYASVVSNGTVSLTIALMALGIGSGDEVIVPDYTMIASANAVVMAGATPVLADIDAANLCLDLEKATAAVTPRTKAIIYVSINGRRHDMNEVLSVARQYNLYLVEDAAQSLGSRYRGRHLGSFGDIGSFSFSTPKVITTGQGGALVTDNAELFGKITRIKDFGRSRGGVDYHETMGFNAKFTDLQAVIGIEQMKKLDWRVQRKKEIYGLYQSLLGDVPGIQFIKTDLEDTSPWFIDLLVDADKREGLAAFLNEQGVGTRPFYPAIHTQPPYAHVKGDFRNSDDASARGLWLPSSSFLTDADIEHVCQLIKGFFTRKGGNHV